MVTSTVLITGSTGFLGGRLARRLRATGRYEVIGTGRNAKRGAALEASGIRFAPVAVEDPRNLRKLLGGVDTVVHAAALSTAWARRAEYWAANVDGTRNVLDAARAAGVTRFLHVSTPAVLSRAEHQFDLSECAPIPTRFTSLYGESKAAAEMLVRDADGIETAVLRPKAIYGRGDTALLPRLIEAAERDRLRIIGDGTTLLDLTHVDDVAGVLERMIEIESVSGIYHVAGPEPVKLWEMISELLPLLGLPAPDRQMSVDRALRIGRTLEGVWRTLRLGGEPPLTRYKVTAVAYSQTLDTSRTKGELGFTPTITPSAGLEDVLAGMSADARAIGAGSRPPKPPQAVNVRPVNLATVRPPAFALGRRAFGRVTMPVLGATIDHPDHGSVSFDVGYGSILERSSWFTSAYRRALRPEAASPPNGAPPTTVIVSHVDPDHVGGLSELSDCRVVMDAAAWESIQRSRGPRWRAMAMRSLPSDLPVRVKLVDTSQGLIDLFGDGTILLIGLPGHAPGHLGMMATDRDGRRFLFCGDAVYGLDQLRGVTSLSHRLLSTDRAGDESTRRILEDADAKGMIVVPSHDAQVAARLGVRL